MIPCQSPHDHCTLPKPCRYKRELDAGLRTLGWVEGRCEELQARGEGFVGVESLSGGGSIMDSTYEATPVSAWNAPRGLDHNGGGL